VTGQPLLHIAWGWGDEKVNWGQFGGLPAPFGKAPFGKAPFGKAPSGKAPFGKTFTVPISSPFGKGFTKVSKQPFGKGVTTVSVFLPSGKFGKVW
jgi:hypothetical protein